MLMSVYRDEPVAVVDAYGAGQLFGPALRARGVHPVHVANRQCDWPALTATLNRHDYALCLEHTGDIDATADELRRAGVRHVVAGTESGAQVADQLAQALGTRTGNRAGLAEARRDKRLMHRLLHSAAVEIPWQRHLDACGHETWSNGEAGEQTVVVKPPRSAGTDSVFVAKDAEHQHRAIDKVLRSATIYGEPNDGVIVQEFLHGPEYMVNTVSADGFHAFIEIWTSEKKTVDGQLVYDRQRLISPLGKEAESIRGYVCRTLDALGVRWGAAHTEVVVTERGPLLLETATRLPGGMDPALTLRAVATSQVGETVDALLSPHLLLERGTLRLIRRHAMGISLISPAAGTLTSDVDLAPIKALASFHGLRANLTAGTRVQRTVDLLTKPGGLYLCHEDPDQLEDDYQQVRAWEATELHDAIDRGHDG
ncbi:ATP-grasp domain-containing protein [Kutzneria sp. CA-103260]|uniref:ATP-grasp domain-containing protein n=1 Tax=Kutzneria sp. CA-103260 TaxID=2802641 RepID=UPI001BAA0210|nr:ATP-grasp domain-containing protein [Kutzneria sp. CA-103260]QUQ64477.1 ATP-grasp domain-containing protein [Kutzneria sp. CA-103260]